MDVKHISVWQILVWQIPMAHLYGFDGNKHSRMLVAFTNERYR